MFLDDNPIRSLADPRRASQEGWATPTAGDELPVTAAAYGALEREREALREEKAQFGERLRLVREFGDTANNDEFLAIREEEAVVDARLARVDDIVSRARVVDPAAPDGAIAIGSIVTVLDRGSGEPFDYVIDSAHSPMAPNAVSAVSPVGKALLGRHPGAVVTVPLPRKGRVRELEVLAVRPLHEA